MKTKMASMFLALTLALGMFGFATAWWSEELTISGTVTTGTFGWEWSIGAWGTSGDDKGIIVFPAPIIVGKDLSFSASDVYPSTDIWIGFDLHYVGSVPGHIKSIDIAPVPPAWMDGYIDVVDITADLLEQRPLLTIGSRWSVSDFMAEIESTQWEYCDYIWIKLVIHFVEYGMDYWTGDPVPSGVDVPEDYTFDFTVTILGEQYNAPP